MSEKVEKFICSLSNFVDSENQRLRDEVRPMIGAVYDVGITRICCNKYKTHL